MLSLPHAARRLATLAMVRTLVVVAQAELVERLVQEMAQERMAAAATSLVLRALHRRRRAGMAMSMPESNATTEITRRGTAALPVRLTTGLRAMRSHPPCVNAQKVASLRRLVDRAARALVRKLDLRANVCRDSA